MSMNQWKIGFRHNLIVGSSVLLVWIFSPVARPSNPPSTHDSRTGFSLTLTQRNTTNQSSSGRYRLIVNKLGVKDGDLIFADGFESGDTSAWDYTESPLMSGAVIFVHDTSCPSGWVRLSDQNRLIVARPAGGQVGGTVQTGLSDLNVPIHNHRVTATIDAPGHSTHYHKWSTLHSNGAWSSWTSGDVPIIMIDWDNGIDSGGSGYYPLSAQLDTEWHTSLEGLHAHALNYDAPTSWLGDMLPYIQLSICVKP